MIITTLHAQAPSFFILYHQVYNNNIIINVSYAVSTEFYQQLVAHNH